MHLTWDELGLTLDLIFRNGISVANEISLIPGFDTCQIAVAILPDDYLDTIQAIVKLGRNINIIVNNNASQIDAFLLQGWRNNLFTAGRAFIIISTQSHLITYSPIGTVILDVTEASVGALANFEDYLSAMLDDGPPVVATRREDELHQYSSNMLSSSEHSLVLRGAKEVEAVPTAYVSISSTDARYPLYELMSGDGYLKVGTATLFDSIHMFGLAVTNATTNSVTGSAPTRVQIGTVMEASTYEGWTGTLSFDGSTGFRIFGHSLILTAYINSTYEVTMTLDDEQQNFTIINPMPTWSGNTTTTPDDDTINLPIAVVMTVDSYRLPNATLRQFFSYAASYINRQAYGYLPPKTQISLLIFPNSSASDVILSAVPLVNYGVIGVLGAVSSTSSTLVQNVVSKFMIPQISPAATSPSLSNSPTFLRTVPSDIFQATAMIALAKRNGWSEISIITSTDTYGSGLSNAVALAAPANGISILSVVSVTQGRFDLSAEIETLKKVGTRALFILHASPSNVIRAMYTANWSPVAVIGSDSMAVSNVYTISSRDYPASFIEGWVCFTPTGGYGSVFDEFVNRTYTSRPRLNPTGVQAVVASGNFIIASIMDALLSFANAITTVNNEGGNPRNGTALLSALRRTSFDGLSGSVSFDSSGDRIGSYDWINFVGGQTIPAGRLSSSGGTTTLTNLNTIVWPGGSTDIPTSPIPREQYWLKWESAGGIILGTLAAAGLVFCVLCCIFLLWQRKSRVVYASGWPFLLAIMLGVALSYASVFPYIGRPHEWICVFRIWLEPLSYAFITVPLLVKTLRLYHFWRQKDLKVVPISTWRLVSISAVLILIQVLICIFWQSLGTIEVVIKDDPSTTTRSLVLCQNNKANRGCAAATMVYEGLLLAIGGYLAFKVRKLPKNFNESRWIGFALYNTLLFSVVIIVISYALKDFPIIVLIFLCSAALVIPTGILVFMFVPKLWELARHPDRRVERSPKKSRRSNGDVHASSMGSSIFLHTPGASTRSHRVRITSFGTTADDHTTTNDEMTMNGASSPKTKIYVNGVGNPPSSSPPSDSPLTAPNGRTYQIEEPKPHPKVANRATKGSSKDTKTPPKGKALQEHSYELQPVHSSKPAPSGTKTNKNVRMGADLTANHKKMDSTKGTSKSSDYDHESVSVAPSTFADSTSSNDSSS